MKTPLDLAYPFSGRWQARNSPADRVPSHGTTLFASAYAIDFVPVDDRARTAPFRAASMFRSEPPERFPGFGRAILAPVDGVVIGAHDAESDHGAHRGIPSIGYALGQRRRMQAGWIALAGNHILIATAGVVVALCHLRQGSVVVASGDRVRVGETIAGCGNSGNSTEPHLHLQAIDDPNPDRARAVPMTFGGTVPRNGEVVSAVP
jgi:hypothetical protein